MGRPCQDCWYQVVHEVYFGSSQSLRRDYYRRHSSRLPAAFERSLNPRAHQVQRRGRHNANVTVEKVSTVCRTRLAHEYGSANSPRETKEVWNITSTKGVAFSVMVQHTSSVLRHCTRPPRHMCGAYQKLGARPKGTRQNVCAREWSSVDCNLENPSPWSEITSLSSAHGSSLYRSADCVWNCNLIMSTVQPNSYVLLTAAIWRAQSTAKSSPMREFVGTARSSIHKISFAEHLQLDYTRKIWFFSCQSSTRKTLLPYF